MLSRPLLMYSWNNDQFAILKLYLCLARICGEVFMSQMIAQWSEVRSSVVRILLMLVDAFVIIRSMVDGEAPE